MEETWKSYLNVIIAVHDVTAYGNYTKFGISSLVLSHFCGSIYVHIILYLISFIWEKSYIDYRTSGSYFSDLDVTVFHYILSVFNYGNYAWIHEVSYYYRLHNIRHRRSLYIFTRCFLASTWSSLELQFFIIWLPYYILNALWTFANKSESAKYWYPNPTGIIAAFSAQRQRPDKGQVKDIANITFFINREDESRLISTSPTAHTPGYYWRGRTFLRPTEQLNLPYSSVGADQSRSNRAATSLPNQRPRRFLIHIAKAHSYINLAGVLGERDLKKRKQGILLLFLGTNWTRAVVFATAPYLYIVNSA